MRFLSPADCGKCVMTAASIWNFVLEREGIRKSHIYFNISPLEGGLVMSSIMKLGSSRLRQQIGLRFESYLIQQGPVLL